MHYDRTPCFWRPPQRPGGAERDERKRENDGAHHHHELLQSLVVVKEQSGPADRRSERERSPQDGRLAPCERRDSLRDWWRRHSAHCSDADRGVIWAHLLRNAFAHAKSVFG